MPGYLLNACCPCGYAASLGPGQNVELVSYVMALNPRTLEIDTVTLDEARSNNWVIYKDPYLYNPFELKTGEDPNTLAPGENKRGRRD